MSVSHRIAALGSSTLRRVGAKLVATSRGFGQSEQARRVAAWQADRGDETLRLAYELTADDIVLDIGGFQGDWAAEIHARYGCRVHVFEPIPGHIDDLRGRFGRNPRIQVHPFGLASQDGEVEFAVDAERSSSVVGETGTRCPVRRAATVLAELGVNSASLVKINIEGGEYDLVPHLIETAFLEHVDDLQIQWHDFVPDAEDRVRRLQADLRRTHELTWCYPFVWENWHRSVRA